STEEYDSYEKEGFEPPQEYYRHDFHQRRFLSRVDVTKGKIRVRVIWIKRTRWTDPETGKNKEYITWNSEWNAKKAWNETLWIREHISGKHISQTKVIKRTMKYDTEDGTPIPEVYYEKGTPVEKYTIPFNKTNVDKILKGDHPFGEDSENITDVEKVMFYAQ